MTAAFGLTSVCPYCRAVSDAPQADGLVCVCEQPCGSGRCGALPGAVAQLWAAGTVDTGPGAGYGHVITRLGVDVWATACPADVGAEDRAPGFARHVRPVLVVVDCPACLGAEPVMAAAVNRRVVDQQQREDTVRQLVGEFLRWAAEEHPDEGGAVLAVYAGGTRLHAMRPDERARAVELWVEASRRYPDG